MADQRIPEEMISWMRGADWGAHHDQWHFERRWDFWHHLAAQGNQEVQKMIDYANQQGWTRADLQEGTVRSGADFLFMHRAMMILLAQNFPQHIHFIRGWTTPPTDPASVEDPVPSGAVFDADKAQGAQQIESTPAAFAGDDEFGLFVETNLRPIPGTPDDRSPDRKTGIHNYLHNRWIIEGSDINLGDPKVNIFNRRFWRLHGWIDHQWWRFRAAKGLSDESAEYQDLLNEYIHMMSGHGHRHEHFLAARERFERDTSTRAPLPRPKGFQHSFME